MNLYTTFKDNCGCGLIANVKNVPSRQMTLDAVEALERMIHRGAIAADQKSGDGCGFLFSMPKKFMSRIATFNGFDLPEKYAVAVIFANDKAQLDVFKETCLNNDLKVLFFREIPVEKDNLGAQALSCLPLLYHAFVVPNSPVAKRRFDALLYLTRKEVGHQLKKDNFYVASFSDKLISYKGLVMPTLMKAFYLDLQDEDFEISFALFHQRFSTNTLPRWSLAQPFRLAAHNGEINSIRSNRFNAVSHMENLESEVFSQEELDRMLPIINLEGSDSASVDNYLEFLLYNGVDFFKAVRSLVPAPWENAPHNDAKLRAFYEYTSGNFEAWDGPAAINITDGRYLACVLDRNGLRPAKYIITTDDRILITSEFGVIDLDDELIKEQGKLKSGQMIAVDLKYGSIFKNKEINDYIKKSQPYGKWLNDNQAYLMEHVEKNFENFSDYRYENLVDLQRYHNYTHEILENIIRPMLCNGKEETGSMGDDTPLACFSEVQRNFTDFFRQKFAQVTNPPIDPLREKVVMSTSVNFGSKNNVLKETEMNAHRVRSNYPILSREKLDVLRSFGTKGAKLYDPAYECKTFKISFQHDLERSLQSLVEAIVEDILNEDIKIVILDDRCVDPDHLLIPMPMVVGYLNTHLQKVKLRSKINIVAITGEVYDSHSAAVLLANGATAIYPYLLFASSLQLLERKSSITQKEKKESFNHLMSAINGGLLKIMSKMGISTMNSYCNSALFDTIGLHKDIVKDCFPGSYPLLSGLNYTDIEERITRYHKNAFKHLLVKKRYALEVGSFYKYMDQGEYHDFAPDVLKSIHKFVQTGRESDYVSIRDRINNRGFRMIRDFFELVSPKSPVNLSKVEPSENIMKRFSSAAMSLGSISPEAHEAVAEAMNTIGGMSNSGEGGEDVARFGTIKNSKIKQVASGRFGVTPAYLRNAEEIQIKVAQGAKPGEGGQLPGSKVSPLIASLRCTNPGVTLISPPPHHDIYSIEDLAQLIFDLKQINPNATISVKLVSSVGVGTIAVGVAKAYADKIIISGADGGTGAAQLGSIKFAGNPWETGLSEAHNALKANQLRDAVELQTDGGLKTGLDVVKAAILGAESYAFGTVLLSTVGCKILRVCHLNKCSVGIATQDKSLREHYVGTVQGIINYLTFVAEEVREILASLGYEKLEDIIGQTHLLKVVDHEFAEKFDFSEILTNLDGINTRQKETNPPFDTNDYEKKILKEITPAIESKSSIEISKKIRNTNRSFGALISGVIAERYGDDALPKETLKINLEGNAGQSFGTFLSNGTLLHLKGTANDYVGKGMRGGHIIITAKDPHKKYSLAGNTCLYGATGGKLFVSGEVGERFAVRNSGALAVVEGTGDHPCEYMTGGTVVILGPTGKNFGAGMTGGVAFVYDKRMCFTDRMNQELIKAERIDVDEADEARYYLRKILESFHRRTGSLTAKNILDHFREESHYFWMVTSKDMKSPLNPIEGN
ncbi:glutamate synthase large subunit [Fulvivirgaceae bacterium BMA10]|uniref:Glutamate synthase large subunit n=1 Tax=Splendidivirga corallicola TaxID=3051826 RepID=A0ABT8KW28_9BACT|nr:glutamate synthase large subunit [Fulvivirgaceae bacterium BMA10]